MKVIVRVEKADYVARHYERQISPRPSPGGGYVMSISHPCSGSGVDSSAVVVVLKFLIQ